MSTVHEYTNESITSYEGPEALRRRPQTLLGSADIHGAAHTIMEIIANSTDEASAGFGDEINVTVYEDNSILVQDHGRGVPMAWSETQNKWNWDLVFNTLYASGKGSKDAAYNDSEGLNGCGCTATQYTSDFMDVTSTRKEDDGYHKYTMHFKKGYPVGDLIDEKLTMQPNIQTGTTVHYRPSAEVFNGEIDVPQETLIARLNLKAITFPGLIFNLFYKTNDKMTFYYAGGIREYLEKNVTSPVTMDFAMIKAENDKCNDTKDKNPNRDYTATVECYVIFSPDSTVQSTFHNGALLKGGATHDSVLKGIAKALTNHGKTISKIGARDNFTVTDIGSIANFVCQTRCNADFSLFAHQTKDALNNPSICKLILNALDVQLTKWFSEHPKESERIIGFALANKSARESADKVRRQAIKQLTQDIHKIGKEPDGYLDCAERNPEKAELYIIEGESAKGNSVFARDNKTQAIQPLRGKIPNCLKKSLEHLLSEKCLILQLLTVFGCGVEIESKNIKDLPKFDESKLNFHKIILAADADVDGGHIIDLCILMIWVMCPTLLRNGYVYTVKTPLYRVTSGKASQYLYSDAEKDQFLKELAKHGIKQSQIQVKRFKGLGEMESSDLRETVMNKNTRQLQRLTCPEDTATFSKMLNVLMGSDLTERRELIINEFSKTAVTTE